MHVNLLPASFQLKLLMRASLRRWSLIWAVALGSALAYCSTQCRDVFDIAERVATLEAQCQPLRKLENEMVDLQTQLTRLESERRILEQLQPDEHSLQLLGLLSTSARQTGGMVQVQRLNYVAAAYPTSVSSNTVRQGPKPANVVPTTEAPRATLSLQGLADDDNALAAFVTALREQGIFQRVELKASSQLRTQGGSNRQYQLECRF